MCFQGDDYVLVCRPRDTGASAVSALTYGYATVFFREVKQLVFLYERYRTVPQLV